MAISVTRRRPSSIAGQPDHPLEAADVCLNQCPPVAAGHSLPAHASSSGNGLQVTIALCRCGLGFVAEHSGGSWWDDRGSVGMTGEDITVDAVLIIRAVGGERCDRSVEQGTHMSAIIDIFGSQSCCHDLPDIGIDANVKLAP